MASYSTNDFKKGLKIQIDGDPYLMVECNFVKPGKGNALYKCRMKNLIRNTMLERTYKGGDSLEAADVTEIDAQYLYRQGDKLRVHGQRFVRAVRAHRRPGRRYLEVDQGGHGLPHGVVQRQPHHRHTAQPRRA